MKENLFLAIVIALLTNCSSEQKDSVNNIDKSFFTYSSIQRTTEIHANIKTLKPLDSLQKRQFIPDITEGLQIDKEFLYCSLFCAYFVSNQDKVRVIQPIIIQTVADDFNALILITLNEKNVPEDFLIVEREEFCGNDDSTSCEKYRHSIFKGNEIITYELFEITSNVDESLFYEDSIVYKSLIDNNGRIKTEKTDSVRIERKVHSQ